MREIKFRAWYPLFKKMINVEDYTFDKWGWFFNDKSLKRMQYTGLTDKNGRDIYEGDLYSYIVTHEFGFGETQRTFIEPVEFKSGAFYCGDELLNDCIDYDDTFTYVGNIYEHRHLLDS